jgi:hypothetical protein
VALVAVIPNLGKAIFLGALGGFLFGTWFTSALSIWRAVIPNAERPNS